MSRWMSAPAAALRVRTAPLSWCSFLLLEVWTLDGVRAVCGACRIVDARLRCRPLRRRDPGLRLGFSIAWEALFSCRPTFLGNSAGRSSGGRPARVGRSSGVTSALRLGGVLDGPTAGWVMGTRCVGSGCSRPSRRFVVPGRGVVGSLRGVVSVSGGPPVGVFGFSMPGCSTSCGSRCWRSRSGRSDRLPRFVGVPLEPSGPGGALLASEQWFEGEIAPLEGELGPRKGQ